MEAVDTSMFEPEPEAPAGKCIIIWESRKKSSSLNGRAIKRGRKTGPLRKIFNFFLFCCYFKIKDILKDTNFMQVFSNMISGKSGCEETTMSF